MKITTSLLNPAMLGLFLGSLWAQQPTARQIMEDYKEQDRTKDSSVEMAMTLMSAGGSTRERQVTQLTKTDADDNRKTLIRFLSPADVAGTGFLSIEHRDRDDDNWLYLPALRKTRRIAGSDKTDQFVGSEFTYEDLDSEDLDAHEYKLIDSESVDGVEAWIVEAVATDARKIEETGYSKRELWISKNRHLIIQAKYYDKDGAYVKLYTAGDIRQVPDSEKWRAYQMTMLDVRENNKTAIEISEFKINQGVQDNVFSERYLKRGR